MTVAANGIMARSETPEKKKKKWFHAQKSPIVVKSESCGRSLKKKVAKLESEK